MIKDAVLDLPLKEKMTETCVAEGAISIVQATPRIGQAIGHLFVPQVGVTK